MKSNRGPNFRLLDLVVSIVVGIVSAGCAAAPQSAPSATHVALAPSPSTSAEITTVEIARDPLDVPYVPTPDNVVAKMLELAQVNASDIVYDLGSGDGRIVVTAAQKCGSRGVGYDLEPKRILEANENARKAGVADRVRFIKQDLFEADLREATVVTLYLLPEVNLKLRPKLLRELKPGARIVSHNYGMGDWNPIRTERLDSYGSEHLVFYWVVPKPGPKPD